MIKKESLLCRHRNGYKKINMGKNVFSISKNHEENIDSLIITEKNANLLIYQLALAA